jgi:hypothetical protein
MLRVLGIQKFTFWVILQATGYFKILYQLTTSWNTDFSDKSIRKFVEWRICLSGELGRSFTAVVITSTVQTRAQDWISGFHICRQDTLHSVIPGIISITQTFLLEYNRKHKYNYASRHSSGQQIPRLLWNRKTRCLVRKMRTVVSVLGHSNRAHTLIRCIFNIHSNSILRSTAMFQKFHSPSCLSTVFLCGLVISTFRITYPDYLPFFNDVFIIVGNDDDDDTADDNNNNNPVQSSYLFIYLFTCLFSRPKAYYRISMGKGKSTRSTWTQTEINTATRCID